MNEVEIAAISLAVGLTVGALVWERLRGDLMPRWWNSRNEERLGELAERLVAYRGAIGGGLIGSHTAAHHRRRRRLLQSPQHEQGDTHPLRQFGATRPLCAAPSSLVRPGVIAPSSPRQRRRCCRRGHGRDRCGAALAGDTAMAVAAGLTVLTIGMWATSALPEHMVAVIFFVLAIVLSVAPQEVVLSGFPLERPVAGVRRSCSGCGRAAHGTRPLACFRGRRSHRHELRERHRRCCYR